jgi:hypothetical protein
MAHPTARARKGLPEGVNENMVLCSTCTLARRWALVERCVPLLDQHWVHLEVGVHTVVPPVVRWGEVERVSNDVS